MVCRLQKMIPIITMTFESKIKVKHTYNLSNSSNRKLLFHFSTEDGYTSMWHNYCLCCVDENKRFRSWLWPLSQCQLNLTSVLRLVMQSPLSFLLEGVEGQSDKVFSKYVLRLITQSPFSFLVVGAFMFGHWLSVVCRWQWTFQIISMTLESKVNIL